MGAFATVRIPRYRTCVEPEETPGPPSEPNRGTEYGEPAYIHPWGRRERNPFFVGPHPEEQKVNDLQKYERDESKNLLKLVEQMNHLHARMGGRDNRPERVALLKAMDVLVAELNRAKTAHNHKE